MVTDIVFSVDSNIELFILSKFPEKIAYTIDIIIKTGHILFSIFPPKKSFFLTIFKSQET